VRTTLAVDENIAKEFSKIVKEKNKVIYAVTNQAINLTIELLKEDVNPDDALMFWRLFKMIAMVDAILIPGSLNETILNKLYSYEKDKVYKIFYDTGREIALKFKVYFPDLSSLLNILNILIRFFPLKKFDLIKKEEKKGTINRLILVGAGQSIITTNCVMSFIRGFFETYGAVIIKETVNLGLIDIEFKY